MGFPHSSVRKGSACNAGDPGSIQESERYPGEGNGNSLQCSCLENPMDRGGWPATVHGVAKSSTRLKQLSTAHKQEQEIDHLIWEISSTAFFRMFIQYATIYIFEYEDNVIYC